MKKEKGREQHKPEAIRIIYTTHSLQRMQERMPDTLELPENDSYVRILTMLDTFRSKKINLIRVKGGVILGKWHKMSFIVLTMFSDKTFSRLQLRSLSRFIPTETMCYHITEIIHPYAATTSQPLAIGA